MYFNFIKLDNSNFVAAVEQKKSQNNNIDTILNQNENVKDMNTNFMSIENNPENNNFDDPLLKPKIEDKEIEAEKKKVVPKNWGKDEDEDEEEDEEYKRIMEESSKAPNNNKITNHSLTIPDEDILKRKLTNSSIIGIQAGLGNFYMCFNYLKSQLGIQKASIEKLKPIIKELYMNSYSHLALVPSLRSQPFKLKSTVGENNTILPNTGITLEKLENLLIVSLS